MAMRGYFNGGEVCWPACLSGYQPTGTCLPIHMPTSLLALTLPRVYITLPRPHSHYQAQKKPAATAQQFRKKEKSLAQLLYIWCQEYKTLHTTTKTPPKPAIYTCAKNKNTPQTCHICNISYAKNINAFQTHCIHYTSYADTKIKNVPQPCDMYNTPYAKKKKRLPNLLYIPARTCIFPAVLGETSGVTPFHKA